MNFQQSLGCRVNAKRTRTLVHLADGLIISASEACMVLIALLVSQKRLLSPPFPSSLYIHPLSDVQNLNYVCVPRAYVSALGSSLDETFLHYVSLSLSARRRRPVCIACR